jgi:hypothetical protein
MRKNLHQHLTDVVDDEITSQIKVQSNEDLPSAVLRFQINELKKKLDSSVYRKLRSATTKEKS